MSENAILSHEAGRNFILNFTIKYGKYLVLRMRQGVVFKFIRLNLSETGGGAHFMASDSLMREMTQM